jgi:signal recognition particle receptor subunit beta
MSFIDHDEREIHFKIVYYGPGLAGKTSNLQYIYGKTSPEQRSKMSSLATETERALFFDFAPRSLPPIRGLGIRFHLYTVPGAVFYDVSRKLLLQNVDGLVLVADSQRVRTEANVEALEELESNLATHGYDLRSVPLVLQYNKRDLPEVLSVAELDTLLATAPAPCPRVEAVASTGVGVFDTLKALAKAILEPLHEDVSGSAD